MYSKRGKIKADLSRGQYLGALVSKEPA